MNIGEAARRSGVSAKMIRHYESIGLLPAAPRSASGYRHYRDNDAQTLRFIRAARDLGFGLDAIGELLSLWRRRDRESREVKALAQSHIATLEVKVAELERMIGALRTLAEHCHGDQRPDCPILDGLSIEHAAAAGHAGRDPATAPQLDPGPRRHTPSPVPGTASLRNAAPGPRSGRGT